MGGSGIIGFLLIIINVIFSYRGFNDHSFFNRYKFEVEKITIYKDYKRLITAGFLHVTWMHLIFNMLSLYFFYGLIEGYLGSLQFLLIYFSSLIGGNLLSLLVYRKQGDYSSVGASGAICGVMFAGIALFPGISIFFMPGWLYGLLYVAISIYGIRSKRDNIGHEAHLGGALIGMIVALAMRPEALFTNYLTILIITVPTLVFIFLIITRPYILLVDNFFYKTHHDHYSIDHKYNEEKTMQQKEIDRILDKISSKGMDSLSRKEKELLKEYSKKVK
jgi:membrane associated rhomboid family serine protease